MRFGPNCSRLVKLRVKTLLDGNGLHALARCEKAYALLRNYETSPASRGAFRWTQLGCLHLSPTKTGWLAGWRAVRWQSLASFSVFYLAPARNLFTQLGGSRCSSRLTWRGQVDALGRSQAPDGELRRLSLCMRAIAL